MRSLEITILCTSADHPVNSMLIRWIEANSLVHSIRLCRERKELTSGDLLFLVSCSEIIGEDVRRRFSKTLVLHASDLPQGRGWSPHVWEIVGGAKQIVLSLIEAQNAVDTGDVWHKLYLPIPPDALFSEINDVLFAAEEEMLDFAVKNFDSVHPVPQPLEGGTYFKKRTPNDSCIDPQLSIEEQFDLIRVCDPERFPAFFELRGSRYKLILEKM